MMSERPSIVILAAGSSSRLGRPKQLVSYREQTLLSYTIQEAKAAQLGEVIVVLGARATAMLEQVKEVKTIMNPNWAQGMGSSIAIAVAELIAHDAEAMILLLCDQPFVTAAIIREVAEAGKQSGIAVCDYSSSDKSADQGDRGRGQGPPTYFSKAYFLELQKLRGEQGAKAVIINNSERVSYVSFPEGRHDIDTIEDLKILKQ